jgi:hypothetical protein
VSGVITITGAGDHDRPDWTITMAGMRKGGDWGTEYDRFRRVRAPRRQGGGSENQRCILASNLLSLDVKDSIPGIEESPQADERPFVGISEQSISEPTDLVSVRDQLSETVRHRGCPPARPLRQERL